MKKDNYPDILPKTAKIREQYNWCISQSSTGKFTYDNGKWLFQLPEDAKRFSERFNLKIIK